MFDSKRWAKAIITEVAAAVHVLPATAKSVHNNRPYHGLVLNEPNSERDYYFSDGTFMHTSGNQLFYLPKNSSYRVYPCNTKGGNGCYAINFDADISDVPFVMSFRDPASIAKAFHSASNQWLSQGEFCQISIIKKLYEIILAMDEEQKKKYAQSASEKLIQPAILRLNSEFLKKDISVALLAEECGITESYFRRVFTRKYGVSPKEYIIMKKIEYAKSLLQSGGFSVSETAVLCGYAEPCHFSREFKKRCGVSPNQYK